LDKEADRTLLYSPLNHVEIISTLSIKVEIVVSIFLCEIKSS